MSVNYGSKRIVTGAGYGFRDWLAQRVTGTLMALFTVILLAQVIFTSGPIGYEEWAGIFCFPVDEGPDLLRHPFPAVPRLGGHA